MNGLTVQLHRVSITLIEKCEEERPGLTAKPDNIDSQSFPRQPLPKF